MTDLAVKRHMPETPRHCNRSELRYFYLQSRYITYVFEKKYKNIKETDVKKLFADCTDKVSVESVHGITWLFSAVYFDYEQYERIDLTQKNQILLKTFKVGVR